MECPNCGGPLTTRGARVNQPMPFRTNPKFKKGHVYTRYRRVYECAPCQKAFVVTTALKECEILSNT